MARQSRRRLVQGSLAMAGFTLLTGCGVPPLPWPRTAGARRIARLSGSLPNASTEASMAAFRQSLRDLGYIEGQTLLIEQRHADGDDRLEEPAAELVRLQPEAILVSSGTVARVVQAATSTIPIVNAGAGDLVAQGLVASLARPGGNLTGLSTPSLFAKQLQLLKEVVPSLSRVAVLFDPAAVGDQVLAPTSAAADALGLKLLYLGASSGDDLASLFAAAAREQTDGLFVIQGPVITVNQTRIGELAVRHGLPSVSQQSDSASRGGLMAYGPNRSDLYRRAGIYVDKLLKGARPADLPVELPTTFDFVINLKTARALGLTVAPSVLQQATEVIE